MLERTKGPWSMVRWSGVGLCEQTINHGPRTKDLTLPCFSANPLPSALQVAQFSVCLTDAQAQREAVIQARVCQIKIAAPVQTIHQSLIHNVASAVPKTDKIQR